MTSSVSSVIALLLILISSGLLVYLTRRYKAQPDVGLKQLRAYDFLSKQMGRAVEKGQPVHFSVGRGSLVSASNPASLAALSALEDVAVESGVNDKPPLVTSGDGTLFIAAQDTLKAAYDFGGRRRAVRASTSQFIAPNTSPMTYGAGVSDILNREGFGSNILLGHYGSEIAIISEAATRQDADQVIGSDDLVAIAAATPVTEELIIGEELFAAAAYLKGEPTHIASLQMQDILRIIVAISIIVAAFITLVIG